LFSSLQGVVKTLIIAALIGVVLWIRFHDSGRAMVADFMAPFTDKREDVHERREARSMFAQPKTDLISHIDQLEEENRQLRFELERARQMAAENAELRNLVSANVATSYSIVTARIVTWDVVQGLRRMRIDQGSADGVQAGQVVLGGSAFLGRVIEVSHHSAVVVTVYDPNCKLSVRLRGSQTHGVLFGADGGEWSAAPQCPVKYLPRDLAYNVGEIVETSSYDAAIPEGLLVGKVGGGEEDPAETIDGLYKQVYVDPAVINETFRFVTVIVRQRPGRPEIGGGGQ
jgi:rod shape-determining protein MreC